MDFGLEFQKSESGFPISILEILCAPNSRQNGQVWISGPKFASKQILVSEFQKSKSRFGIRIPEILGAAILRQKQQFWTFGLKFGLKWILGLELQKS